MLWKDKTYKILLSPYALALIITGGILFFFPNSIKKYETEIIDKKTYSKDAGFLFEDLDNDGYEERIYTRAYQFDSAIYEVHLVDGKTGGTIDQYNIKGNMGIKHCVFTHDYNNNGTEDIWTVTFRSDSAFLTYFDIYEKPVVQHEQFLCKVHLLKGNIDHGVKYEGKALLDGQDEFLIIAINGLFAIEPRRILAFNPSTKDLRISPRSGAKVTVNEIFDIDQDGKDELLLSSNAPFNIHYAIPYPDSVSWLMVLDDDMDFLFEPIPFNQKFSATTAGIGEKNDGRYTILAVRKHNNYRFEPEQFDLHGQLLSRFVTGMSSMIVVFDSNQLVTKNGDLFHIDDGKFVKQRALIRPEERFGYRYWSEPLNLTRKEPRIIINDQNGTVGLLFNNFNERIDLPKVQVDVAQGIYSFQIANALKLKPFILRSGNTLTTLKLIPNQYHAFRHLYGLIIYLGVLAFIFLAQYLQRVRTRQLEMLERQIAELQLQTIKNQLDPHFTFNAVNAIGSVIMKEDKLVAYDYFTKFSDLIRGLLKNSSEVIISLQEELDFVLNYLEIEKFRFKDKFEFTIEIDSSVDTKIRVPKFMIQTYVENAVKHGLMPLKDNGTLRVGIRKKSDHLEVSIVDNGIGLDNNSTISNSTRKGLETMNDFYKVFHKLYNQKISTKITGNQNSTGTHVKITIQLNDKSSTNR